MPAALPLTGLFLAALLFAPAAAAPAREPRLTVDRARLAAAVTCYDAAGSRGSAPILVVPGTGSDGSQVYALGKSAFDAIGRRPCTVSLPDRATADLQISVQYVVHAIRALSRGTGRRIAVAGISQGGLLARVALTYWPSLQRRVADVVTAAATHHGAVGTPEGAARCLLDGCAPAIWQQAARSRFVRALNDGQDETPGAVAYTTVRSANDDVVQPQTGRAPTSALRGASNILIQDVCPGRTTDHIGTAVDSVTIAALRDAVRHRGPARASRLPEDVCTHPYGTGLDEQQTSAFLDIAAEVLARGVGTVPVVRAEPRLRSWMRRRS
jgi:triacylglycerol esterase/lipase EstA (alpha/beta hydrolase family)